MISDEPRSTAAQRHNHLMGRTVSPHDCPLCGQDTGPEDAARDLRLALLGGDEEAAERLRKRLTAIGINPGPIEARARKEATQ